MQKSLPDPKSVVISFASDYSAWEQSMNVADGALENARLHEQHRDILLKYCTHKKRKYVDGVLAFSDPPTYGMVNDDSIVSTECVTSTRAHIDTRQLDRPHIALSCCERGTGGGLIALSGGLAMNRRIH